MKWTHAEDAMLKKLKVRGCTDDEIQVEIPGRTFKAIQNRWTILNVIFLLTLLVKSNFCSYNQNF